MKSIPVILLSAIWLALPVPGSADHEVVEGREATISLGPEEISAEQAGIGKRIPDLVLGLIGGSQSTLYAGAGGRGTVVVVRDPRCPVSRRYGPTIAGLAKRFGSDGFGFVFIYPNEDLRPEDLQKDADSLGISGSFVAQGSFALGWTAPCPWARRRWCSTTFPSTTPGPGAGRRPGPTTGCRTR